MHSVYTPQLYKADVVASKGFMERSSETDRLQTLHSYRLWVMIFWTSAKQGSTKWPRVRQSCTNHSSGMEWSKALKAQKQEKIENKKFTMTQATQSQQITKKNKIMALLAGWGWGGEQLLGLISDSWFPAWFAVVPKAAEWLWGTTQLLIFSWLSSHHSLICCLWRSFWLSDFFLQQILR